MNKHIWHVTVTQKQYSKTYIISGTSPADFGKLAEKALKLANADRDNWVHDGGALRVTAIEYAGKINA